MITTDSALSIRHHESCLHADPYETIGRQGDRLLRCRSCRHFVVLPPAPVTPAAAAAVPAKVRKLSRYHCRAHLLPVTWRGTGCPECAAELRAVMARRAARRERRRAAAEAARS